MFTPGHYMGKRLSGSTTMWEYDGKEIYNFALDTYQGHAVVKNVRDTSSHGDTSLCQIWSMPMSKDTAKPC